MARLISEMSKVRVLLVAPALDLAWKFQIKVIPVAESFRKVDDS